MDSRTSLRDLERDLFRSSIMNGLIDIQIGCVALIFVIALYLSPYLGDFWSSAVIIPIWAVIFFALRTFRKKVLQPRVGTIEYGPYRKKKLTRINIIILIVNLAAFALGLLSFRQALSLSPWIHTARFSIVILTGFSLAGYMLEFPRLYLYGITLAAAPILGELLYQHFGAAHHGFPITFGISGGIMILAGLVILLRLLRKYPASDPESAE